MRHGSLFSGIGGFDLAAEWMGWENIFHCEWNPFGQKVLNHYWPKAQSYADITTTDFTIHRGDIDILTGGFPCQPYSGAGKRLGKEDDRHLWPEMLRAIREVQPCWIVGENVLGLVNWNGGLVFEEVQSELEATGYEVLAFILPACAVNAPHRRDRVWFVAYSGSKSQHSAILAKNDGIETQRKRVKKIGGKDRFQLTLASYFGSVSNKWLDLSQSSLINDGIPAGLDTQTLSDEGWIRESVKGAGNAVVPQMAYQIFTAIEKYEQSLF